GPVQFHTVPLNLFIASIQKNHKEKISFNVLPMNYHLVLGIPWLRLHNPDIIWSSDSIRSFRSNSCELYHSGKPTNNEKSPPLPEKQSNACRNVDTIAPKPSYDPVQKSPLSISISFSSSKSFHKIVSTPNEAKSLGCINFTIVDKDTETTENSNPKDYARFHALFDKKAAD